MTINFRGAVGTLRNCCSMIYRSRETRTVRRKHLQKVRSHLGKFEFFDFFMIFHKFCRSSIILLLTSDEQQGVIRLMENHDFLCFFIEIKKYITNNVCRIIGQQHRNDLDSVNIIYIFIFVYLKKYVLGARFQISTFIYI